MTHSCTVRAQCARIMERSGRGDSSNSFAIKKNLVDVAGIEPATPCLQNSPATTCKLLHFNHSIDNSRLVSSGGNVSGCARMSPFDRRVTTKVTTVSGD